MFEYCLSLLNEFHEFTQSPAQVLTVLHLNKIKNHINLQVVFIHQTHFEVPPMFISTLIMSPLIFCTIIKKHVDKSGESPGMTWHTKSLGF